MNRLLIFYGSFSLLFILLFVNVFPYSNTLIIGHFLFAAIIHGGFIFLSSFLPARILNNKFFFIAYFTFYFTVWILFYLLVFISNYAWGDTIELQLALKYLPNISQILGAYQFSAGFYLLAFISYLILAILIHFLFYRKGVNPFNGAAFLRIVYRPFRMPRTIILFSITSCSIVFGFWGLWEAKRYFHKMGEPLFKFYSGYMWGVNNSNFFKADQLYRNKAEDLARQQWDSLKETGNHRNVVIIVFDAWRADNIAQYGYKKNTMPFLDSLLATGAAFKIDNCYATANSTIAGVSSMLLSRSYRNISATAFGLPESLKKKGYQINVIVTGEHTGWYSLGQLYKKYADFFFQGKDSKKYILEDDRIALEGLEKMPVWEAGRGSFLYLHLASTHNLGVLLDEYRKDKPDLYNPITDNEKARNLALENNYNNRLRQGDAILKAVFDLLTRKGYLKNTTILLTSDHGQSLGEGGRTGHVSYLHREAIRIPLIILNDSSVLYRNKQLARQIDISPTIISRLGLPVPAIWQGHSLLYPLNPNMTYHENGGGDLKYHGLIENDSNGSVYRYLFSTDYKEEELVKVSGNTEVDIFHKDSLRLGRYRRLTLLKFDSLFVRPVK